MATMAFFREEKWKNKNDYNKFQDHSRNKQLEKRPAAYYASWQLPKMQMLHGTGSNKGLLRIVQNIG